jgi:predicted RNA methylase
MNTSDYPPTTTIATVECAKLIRAALKRAFPDTKFSVRSSKYSMGSSIDVSWTDGPTRRMVETLAGQYHGSSFDGMIDLKSHFSSWLLPDGSAIVALDRGTEGSRGSNPARSNPKPHPDARHVHFSADSVHCSRSMSPIFAARVLARVTEKWQTEALHTTKITVSNYDGHAGFDTNDSETGRLLWQEGERFMMMTASCATLPPAVDPSATTEGRTISDHVLEILGHCTTEGNRCTLPRLSRADYVAVAAVLTPAGFAWNKKAQALLCDPATDAADIIDSLMTTGKVSDLKKTYGCFDSPEELANAIALLAAIEPGMRVLEPSAGNGNLVRPLLALGAVVDCVELLPDRVATLRTILSDPRFVKEADFLTVLPSVDFRYDRIVMNPPFAKRADLAHVRHALGFLSPKGRLVAVMSAGVTFRQDKATVAFRELVAARGGTIEPLAPDSFKVAGTAVNAVIVTIPG